MGKVVRDGGAREIAASPLLYDDRGNEPDEARPEPSSLDPFGGLCDPRESALWLSYLADMGNFEEARSHRLKSGRRKNQREKEEPLRSRGSGKGQKEKKSLRIQRRWPLWPASHAWRRRWLLGT